MKTYTAQRWHKIMSGRVVTAIIGLATVGALIGAGFLLAVITLGTVATPSNPTQPTRQPSVSPTAELSDPYVRCLLAMDAAELAPELCEPLND